MTLNRLFFSKGLKRVALAAGVAALAFGLARFFGPGEERDGLYNAGSIPIGEEIIHEFLVPNPFPENLAIADVRASHADARVVSHDASIPAHGRGVVRVSIRPTRVGPLVARFYLDYSGKRHSVRQMGLRAEVAPPALPPRPGLDSALVISAPELLGLQGEDANSAPVVVDLRGPEDFRRLHIPGALNMSSSQLKASRHLMRRTLILVDEGQLSAAARDVVAQLRAIGFDFPRILGGGMAAWQALGAPVIGTDGGLPVAISPAAGLEAVAGGWMVLDAQTSAGSLPQAVSAVRVPASALLDEAEVRKLRESLPPASRLVVLTDDGVERENLRQFVRGMEGIPVVFVRDGVAGLNREYLRMAAASAKPASNRINGTAIASARRISRSMGGCSSCP